VQKYDVVILHGTGGSPDGNWFPWLKNKLESVGHNVYVPRFPTPEGQSVKNWCKVLDKQAPRFGRNTILIGHSCGAAYILSILEIIKEPIAASIFVSGFMDKLGNDYFDTLNDTFINKKFDWGKIKTNAGKITIFHGDNDPYVSFENVQKLSNKLSTPITVIPNGGHLNSEFGYLEFPEILKCDVLKQK
jgi:predicted alpha/beta hydrolase family esterase